MIRFLRAGVGLCMAVALGGSAGRAALGAELPKYYGPNPARKIADTKTTYVVSPDGDDKRDGRTRPTAWATLQKAADAVQPGDTVLVTRGVYRQTMHVRKEGREDAWITFLAESGAEIRGSDVRRDWTRLGGEMPIYRIPLPPCHPAIQKFWRRPDTPLTHRVEQVFVNGALLRHVPDRCMLKPKGTFHADDQTQELLICLEGGKDPNKELTEVSVRDHAIAIGGEPNTNTWPEEKYGLNNKAAYVRLDGFTVRHCANFMRMAAVQVRGLARHIVVENCDVQWASFYGVGVHGHTNRDVQTKQWFQHWPEHVVIRHCLVSNNGVQGIAGGEANDCIVEHCVIDNNNFKGVTPYHEGGGVKVFGGGRNWVLRGNVVRHNDNFGLWLDYMGEGCLIENNLVCGSLMGGILDEVTPAPPRALQNDPYEWKHLSLGEVRALDAKGTMIRHNVVAGTRTPGGSGVSVSSSNHADVHGNVLYGNAAEGIAVGGMQGRQQTAGCKGNRVHGNICLDNAFHAGTVGVGWDPGGCAFDNLFRANLFLRAKKDPPLLVNGKAVKLDDWRTANRGGEDELADRNPFRKPERWDFTLTDAALARRIGLDPTALRLDWSEFAVTPPVRSRRWKPVDLGLAGRTHGPIPAGRVFYAPFDGDLDAVWQTGEEVEPLGYSHLAFDAGRFVDGVRGKAFHPVAPPGHTDQRAVSYPIPPGFPTQGKGTVSMWLRLDDPYSAARLQNLKREPWATAMRFLESYVSAVLIEKGEKREGRDLRVNVGPTYLNLDATALVKPMQWVSLVITWRPGPKSPAIGQIRVYVDGKLAQTTEGPTGIPADKVSSAGLYVGNSPTNGPWWGAIDELAIWNRDLSEAEVKRLATPPTGDKR